MIFLRLLLAAILALVVCPRCVAAPFSILDLGALDPSRVHGQNGYSIAEAINSLGQVAGEAPVDYPAPTGVGYDAFRYTGGPLVDLGALPINLLSSWTPHTRVYDINGLGQVVGGTAAEPPGSSSSFTFSTSHAFFFNGSSFQDLGTLPGDTSSYATGVSDAGVIIGTSAGSQSQSFVYFGGAMHAISTLIDPAAGYTNPHASDIAANGDILAQGTVAGQPHDFVQHGGAIHDLGSTSLPNGSQFGLTQISATGNYFAGLVVGPSGITDMAVMDAAGHLQIVPHFAYTIALHDFGTVTFDARFTEVTGVNSLGQAIGLITLSAPNLGTNAYTGPFLYSGGVTNLLPTLVDPSGWSLANQTDFADLKVARGINDRGQIVGYGIDASGANVAYLITPVPEPSTRLLASAAILAFVTMGIVCFVRGAPRRRGPVLSMARVWLAVAIAEFMSTCCFAASYSILDLGELDPATTSTSSGGSVARAINSLGQVAGDATVTYAPPAGPIGVARDAFFYAGGPLMDRGTLVIGFQPQTIVTGMNDVGQVVGATSMFTSTGFGWNDSLFLNPGARAFASFGGSPQNLGTLPGDNASWALGISDDGTVIGVSESTVSHQVHSFLYSGGLMHDFATLVNPASGFTNARAIDINANGYILGQGTLGGQTHGFVYHFGAIQDLGPLVLPGGATFVLDHISEAGNYFSGEAVDFAGVTTGVVMSNTGQVQLISGFQYTTTLNGLGPVTFTAHINGLSGVNSFGQAIGHVTLSNPLIGPNAWTGPFLYSGGVVTMLPTLVDPTGWRPIDLTNYADLTIATDINDRGQIVGSGNLPNNRDHAFLMTPVPEPSTLALVVAAVAACAVFCGLRVGRPMFDPKNLRMHCVARGTGP